MKCNDGFAYCDIDIVLPLTREWIEIKTANAVDSIFGVLPLTREWIEIV